MKVSFFLDKPKEKESLIYVSISNNYNRIKRSTKLKIKVKDWNSKKKEVRVSDEMYMQKNYLLKEYEKRLIQYFSQLRFEKQINKTELMKFWESLIDQKNIKISLVELADVYIKHQIKSKGLSLTTLQKVKTTRTKLTELDEIEKKTHFPEDVNYDYFVKLMNFMIERYKTQNTSFFKYMDNIITILNWGLENEHHDYQKFNIEAKKIRKRYKSGQSKREPLTANELEALEKLDLSNHPEKANHRDVFLYKTYLCLRYEDLKQMKDSNIISKELKDGSSVEVLRYYSNKNKEVKEAVIGKKCKELLKKRPITNINLITPQKFNDHLKEICRLAGIDSEVVNYKHYGLKVKEERSPKWQTVSSHLARHTHITLLSTNGLSQEEIRKLTGHKSKALDTYINPDKMNALKKGEELF